MSPIGFVGLGSMGLPIAKHLLTNGWPLLAWNRTQARGAPLAEAGAVLVGSPADAATAGGIVFTMVADDRALLDVTLGEHGFIDRLGTGGIHVSMSTVAPATARALAAEHARRGSLYVAAPVFARPVDAEAGAVRVCLAGPEEAKARVRPLVQPFASHLFDLGEDPANANVFKLTGNFMLMGLLEMIGEAVTLLDASGVDRERLRDILPFIQGAVGRFGDTIIERRHEPAHFRLQLGLKDANLVRDAAAERGFVMPVIEAARSHFEVSVQRGRGELDWSGIALTIAEDVKPAT